MGNNCKFPNCITKLNKANKDKFCSLHTRVLFQQGVILRKNKFYFEADKKHLSKGKVVLPQAIPLGRVTKLKEGLSVEDFLYQDRLQ
jgi:hypothetical protein